MKKMKAISLGVALMTTIAATASDFSDVWKTGLQTNNTVYIIGVQPGVELKGNVIIPAYDDEGNKIVGIGRNVYNVVDDDKYDPAISNFKYIETVTLPSTLEKINDREFTGCSGIKAFYVQEGNTHFFTWGGSLYTYDNRYGTQNSTWELVRYTPYNYFVHSWNVPEEVSYIRPYAFADCQELWHLYVPSDNADLWGAGAMLGNRSIKDINITKMTATDDRVRLTSNGGVLYNKNGTELFIVPPYNNIGGIFEIPDEIESIRPNAFSSCALSEIKFSGKPITIGHHAFQGSYIRSIKLGREVTLNETQMGKGLFQDCSELKTADISSLKITKIPDDFFRNCAALNDYIVNTGMTKLGSHCFYGCKSLTDISLGLFDMTEEDMNTAQFAFAYSGLTKAAIPSNWKIVPYACFMGCNDMTEVSFSNGVDHLGKLAFHGCGIKVVNTNQLTKIENWAFQGCPLTRLAIEEYDEPLGMGIDVAKVVSGALYLPDRELNFIGIGEHSWLSSIKYDSDSHVYSSKVEPETFYSHWSSPWYRLWIPAATTDNYSKFGKDNIHELYTLSTDFEKGSVFVKAGDFSRSINEVYIDGQYAMPQENNEYTIGRTVNSPEVKIKYTCNGARMTSIYPAGFLTESSSAIENVEMGTDFESEDCEIYTIEGIMIKSVRQISELNPGLYIIKDHGKSRTIRVK